MVAIKFTLKNKLEDVNLELYLQHSSNSDSISLVCKSGSTHRVLIHFEPGGCMRLQQFMMEQLNIFMVTDRDKPVGYRKVDDHE